MITFTCQLKFSDGATVVGKIDAESANADYVVDYSGAVERLPRRYDTADVPQLRALFRVLADETGAEFTEQSEGEYDRWAQ